MNNYRIYVEKLPEFSVEAESLRKELNENLSMQLLSLRYINVYDLFGFSSGLLEKCRYSVFGERVTDEVKDECPLEGKKFLAVEFIPGQFDQRASSAVDCVHLIEPDAQIEIKSAKLYIFDDDLSDADLQKIKHYLINAVECREKNLHVLTASEPAEMKQVGVLDGFLETKNFDALRLQLGLSIQADDLRVIADYFTKEGRNPTDTELRILDTYWSDHCRHTTFTSEITEIKIDDSFMKEELSDTLDLWQKIRTELHREHKSRCLMELATIGARYLKSKGLLDDLEQSEENNACSIYIDVDVDGRNEKWLLQFKNETHNHPTEIEPFGGASTCLGGAIRDPLSGRAYVYQAMRVTGAGDIYKPVRDTLAGKLPQKVISRKAAAGYSSYGNQIGLATTHVREIYHDGYTAKRLEVGAVVGAVKAGNVRRESPAKGDIILMLGGRTGRDGIGGATGASKKHTESSLEVCGSEVQKGNAPEERKLQRLFRHPEVTRLIKKSNDFGAGGVSVAIGELADGLDIYLDRVPVKYTGLNSTELAISESQERMAVVIEAKDEETFINYCRRDNVEVTHVADVTDTGRMRIFNGKSKVADLTREFIDSAGAKHFAQATLNAVEQRNPLAKQPEGRGVKEKILSTLQDKNVLSQKGLIEMFDSTIGRSTVLMPFGGKTQLTETQVSVQKLPMENTTGTASVMAFGFNPDISEWSPYHGAAYAVIEACTKVVASGADWSKMRFSYQEYFERMTSDPHTWGKPLAALLGTLKMQVELGLPSIGGKDSMSGSFEKLNVPPTLIAFGITTVPASKVISPEFKHGGHKLYLFKHQPLANFMPNIEQLKKNWNYIHEQISFGNIVSAYAIGFGGAAEALAKMSFGNHLGFDIQIPESELFDCNYGTILVETVDDLPQGVCIGKIINDANCLVNGVAISIDEMIHANFDKFATVYPLQANQKSFDIQDVKPVKSYHTPNRSRIDTPNVYIPVFPGTNCDYDTAKAFRMAGATTEFGIFRNLTPNDVIDSIKMMQKGIAECEILVFSGGFSLGDEPDGSAKFIASVINNEMISVEIEKLLKRGGLILGICNGFQALVKSGLLPYGKTGMLTPESPTLFRNDINRHVSQMVTTRVATVNSPWLSGFAVGDLHTIAVSHGEGKFVVKEKVAKELFDNGQVAFQYVNPTSGRPTMEFPDNPNGSYYAIEGIISPCGQILGKMGHSERYEQNIFKNIPGCGAQNIFENAVNYLKNEQSTL